MGSPRKSLGSKLGYRLLALTCRVFGYAAVVAIARLIAVFYRLALPRVVASSVEFYGALFPDSTMRRRRSLARAQIRSFTTVFIDRFLLSTGQRDELELTHEGIEEIVAAAREKRPLILWMAHLGNWEIAAHCLKRFEVPLTLVIGKYENERLEAEQREQLVSHGVRCITVEGESNLGVVEVVNALRRGELVAISGDRLYDDRQRPVEVEFLGRTCLVPQGPYVLAGLTGAPIVPAFGLREGKLRYRFIALEPRHVDFSKHEGRTAAIGEAAQSCFDGLTSIAHRYPAQWYNFFNYWRQGRSLNAGDLSSRKKGKHR
jgi:predicted LPLAT superfamily acyltransferase